MDAFDLERIKKLSSMSGKMDILDIVVQWLKEAPSVDLPPEDYMIKSAVHMHKLTQICSNLVKEIPDVGELFQDKAMHES